MKQQSERQESIRFRASTTAAAFIVRATRGPFGELTGVVERVATGQKERFDGCEAAGAVISRMLAREDGA